ncbi:MAG: aminodeoxychorismate/anthranilate synthase component II [Pedobacter sp.]|nr:MAG: aminodeoxychorismate/anthranilate synthase component II [Pedobacter sp.]
MKPILIIDNYDSFTYNLVHLIQECGFAVEVWRNDKFDLNAVEAFDKIVLSPGPGIPEEAGLLIPLIKRFAANKSLLGVCLGQQAIAESFGGTLLNLGRPKHGVASKIRIVDAADILFKDLPEEIEVGRYHSWVVNPVGFPKDLVVTALDEENQIMALKHKTLQVHGVQFHPESVLTPLGKQIIENWLNN